MLLVHLQPTHRLMVQLHIRVSALLAMFVSVRLPIPLQLTESLVISVLKELIVLLAPLLPLRVPRVLIVKALVMLLLQGFVVKVTFALYMPILQHQRTV